MEVTSQGAFGLKLFLLRTAVDRRPNIDKCQRRKATNASVSEQICYTGLEAMISKPLGGAECWNGIWGTVYHVQIRAATKGLESLLFLAAS